MYFYGIAVNDKRRIDNNDVDDSFIQNVVIVQQFDVSGDIKVYLVNSSDEVHDLTFAFGNGIKGTSLFDERYESYINHDENGSFIMFVSSSSWKRITGRILPREDVASDKAELFTHSNIPFLSIPRDYIIDQGQGGAVKRTHNIEKTMKQYVMFNKYRYVVRHDGKKKYIVASKSKVYLSEIRGKYKYC